jgi:hypothetical protein
MITGKYVAVTDNHFIVYLVNGLPKIAVVNPSPRETWFFTYSEGCAQKEVFSQQAETFGTTRHRQLDCDRLLLAAESVSFHLENSPPAHEDVQTPTYHCVKGQNGLTWFEGREPLASFAPDGRLLDIWNAERAHYTASYRHLFQLPRAAA